MKNNDNKIEKMLLEGATLDDLIKMKMEEDFKRDIEKSKQTKEKKVYTDIAKVPKELIFTKSASFRIFNRNTKCETFIDGMQAEALIGMRDNVRKKMLEGALDAFTTEDYYIKFDRAEAEV